MDLFHWVLLFSTLLYVSVAIVFVFGLSRRFQINCDNSYPYVSVVVAVRNEENFIEECLKGLASQTYPTNRFEVLVVDDNSEDKTPEIVARIASHHKHIRCLSVGNGFPKMVAKKRPLSVGIQEAQGEIILTTDADCQVPANWISGTVACFEPDVGVVIGFSQIKKNGSFLTFFERLQALDFLVLMSVAAGSANIGLPLAASGQNLAYRKSIFDNMGGFHPIGHRPSGDDVLLLQMMRRNSNTRIVFNTHPETFVSTWRTDPPKAFWQQRRRWASNAIYQIKLNRLFFVYIFNFFLVNLLVPLGLLTGTNSEGFFLTLVCWLNKVFIDFIVASKGAITFDRRDLLWILPVWEALQIPYIVLVGLAGSLFGFTWKGRQYH